MNGSSASGPASAALNSSTFSAPMPANQSMPVRRLRRHAGDDGRAADAIRQERGARQRVGAAAGPAEEPRPVDAEMVERERRVGGDVRDAAPPLARGAAVARAASR